MRRAAAIGVASSSRPRRKSLLLRGLAILAAAACSNILGIEDDNTQVTCVSNADCAPSFACQADHCVCVTSCGGGGDSGEAGAGGGAGLVAGAPAGAMSGVSGRANAGASGEAGSESNGGESGTGLTGSGGKSGSGGRPQGGSGGADGGRAGGGQAGETGGTSSCDALHPECPATCGTRDLSKKCPTCTVDEVCEVPPSCLNMTNTCGDENASCCSSLPVPGGDFLRGCDSTCRNYCVSEDAPDFPATVAPFSLDVFEVTVARFRAFVDQYPSSKPKGGAGANSHGSQGKGWESDWDSQLLPSRDDFRADLAARDCPGALTWSIADSGADNLPMTCVTWFEAAAFCIWDHGRLPTEAEWNFAAAGGSEQRIFPWSSPPADSTYDATYTVFSTDPNNRRTGPELVGSHPLGRGKWGHDDLAGNVTEWVWDALFDCYRDQTCENCGSAVGSEDRVARGGGFSSLVERLTVDSRDRSAASLPHDYFGFRCARDR